MEQDDLGFQRCALFQSEGTAPVICVCVRNQDVAFLSQSLVLASLSLESTDWLKYPQNFA